MGGMLEGISDFVASPFSTFGPSGGPSDKGSTVNTGGVPVRTDTAADQAAGEAAQRRIWEQQQQQQWQDQQWQQDQDDRRAGFLASRLPQQPTTPVAQGGWAYQPGKGASWMEQKSPEAGAAQPAPWAATSGASPFKGNRI